MINSNPRETRSIIPAAKIVALRSVYFNNPFVFICRNLIHSKIFENGLCLNNNKDCKNNPLTQQIMDSYWVPFAKDIIDSVMCIGLVPFRYRKVNTEYIPYIPTAGTYEIHVVTNETGTTKFQFFSNDKPIDINKPTPDAFVLSGFGYDPEKNAQIRSTVSCLYPVIRFTSDLHDYAIMAEKLRSNPPIIMQKKNDTNSSEEEGLHFDAFIDSDAVKVNLHNQYQRDKGDIARLREQQRLFLSAIEGRDPMKTNNQETAMKNMVPLPTQYSVGTTLEPNSRTDFVSIQRLNQESICALIGVPRSMIINDSVTRADIQGSHDVFRQTLIYWKKNIANVLTNVYHIIYEEYERNRLTAQSKKRKRLQLDNFMIKSLTRIEIPTVPYVSNDELRSLYLQGVISWKHYGEYMLRNASLPIDILNGKEEWSKEDRKEFMGVSIKPPDSEGTTKAPPMARQGSSTK